MSAEKEEHWLYQKQNQHQREELQGPILHKCFVTDKEVFFTEKRGSCLFGFDGMGNKITKPEKMEQQS